MRKAHWLKTLKKTSLPSHFIFVDTETKNKDISDSEKLQVLWFGYACYVRRLHGNTWTKPKWKRFEKRKDYWDWVMSHLKLRTKLYIFSHNQAFDFTVLRGFSTLRRRGFKLRKAIIESPPTILIFKKDGKTICILDTYNYFRLPVKSLGKAMGIDKLEMPEIVRSKEVWNQYCKRDVEILLKLMLFYIGIVKDWELGGFQFTGASQAFAAFRHRFMKCQLLIDDNVKALGLARSSYYGGRTECFHIGEIKGELYLVDINSQYPFVMKYNKFPTKLVSVWNNITDNEFNGLIRKYSLCCEVLIKTDVPIYPYIQDKRLIFPVGEFITNLTTPEIIEAKGRGHIKRVMKAAIYENADIFSEYVDFFYNKRMEFEANGNKELSFMCKIMLNSLYGKFGQNGYIYETTKGDKEDKILTWDELDLETGIVYKYRQFGGIIQTLTKDSESYNSHPAISGHVTSYARLYLYHLIEQAKHQNVYYCDTDSLLINKEGLYGISAYLHDTNLGALKIERKISRALIRAPKDYIFDEIEKIKGIRKNAVQISENTYQQDVFPGFKGMIQKGNLDDFIIKTIEKHLTRSYKKGNVSAGGEITPFLITNSEV